MATVAPKVGQVFPVGTSVGAYPASGWPATAVPPSGAPVPSATESQTVGSDGTVTFTTLTDNTPYFLGAQVGGVWRYTRVVANPTPQGQGNWLVGTHAGRPAASAAPYRGYYETDTGLAFASDGTNWNSIKPGQQIGYAQIVGQISTTSLSLVDASGLTTGSITVGARPIMIHAFFPWLTHTVDQKLINAAILEGSTTVSFGIGNASGAGGGEGINVWAFRNPGAGSYTYKVQYDAGSAGTAVMWADPTFPAFIRVQEV